MLKAPESSAKITSEADLVKLPQKKVSQNDSHVFLKKMEALMLMLMLEVQQKVGGWIPAPGHTAVVSLGLVSSVVDIITILKYMTKPVFELNRLFCFKIRAARLWKKYLIATRFAHVLNLSNHWNKD